MKTLIPRIERAMMSCALACLVLAIVAVPTSSVKANEISCIAVCGIEPDPTRDYFAWSAWLLCTMGTTECAYLNIEYGTTGCTPTYDGCKPNGTNQSECAQLGCLSEDRKKQCDCTWSGSCYCP